MKKLHFQYKMELKLDGGVRDHHFLFRCRPMENGRQHCERFTCRMEPEASFLEVEDGFGNCGYAGVIRQPHDHLLVEADGVVQVREAADTRFHPMYRYPSAYTAPDAGLAALLSEAEAAAGGPVTDLPGLLALMNRLHGRFVYAPGVTSVKTTAAQALAGGRGVCQDYTHIFISLCRLAGIPARYVAGLVPGEGATHAWAEVWTGSSWTGMDPTNDRLVDETYIKLTHGRDFADAAVDKGCFLGFASQTQQIYVKVEEET